MKESTGKKKKGFSRLEDSLSKPENQRRQIEDSYVEKREQELLERLRDGVLEESAAV